MRQNKKFLSDFLIGFCIIIFICSVPPIGTYLEYNKNIQKNFIIVSLFLSITGIIVGYITKEK